MQVAGRAYINNYSSGAVMEMVGLESQGYFDNELKSLHGEIQTLAGAIGASRSMDRFGQPMPVSQEQEEWFAFIWSPFYTTWRNFYSKYAFGWRTAVPLIMQSRLTQMEEYRKKFILLQAQAQELLKDSPSTALRNLPKPSPPKKYQGAFDDLLEAMGDMVAGIVKWVLIGGVLVLAFFFVRGRI
jgi:hypothetical protein